MRAFLEDWGFFLFVGVLAAVGVAGGVFALVSGPSAAASEGIELTPEEAEAWDRYAAGCAANGSNFADNCADNILRARRKRLGGGP